MFDRIAVYASHCRRYCCVPWQRRSLLVHRSAVVFIRLSMVNIDRGLLCKCNTEVSLPADRYNRAAETVRKSLCFRTGLEPVRSTFDYHIQSIKVLEHSITWVAPPITEHCFFTWEAARPIKTVGVTWSNFVCKLASLLVLILMVNDVRYMLQEELCLKIDLVMFGCRNSYF